MDESTYIALCRENLTAFHRMALSITGSRPDAEDAVQQALMKAWQHRHQARPGLERAWVMRILVNECYTLLRQRKKVIPMEELPTRTFDVPGDSPLQAAVRALPETLRTPLLLKYMEGMTEKEVAEALRLPLSSVKNRLFRARKLLRKELNEEVSP